MKNVLLVTYSFPPEKNIGAIRPRGIAKYLPVCGWNVIVITPVSIAPRDRQFNVVETYPSLRQNLGYLRKRKVPDFKRIPYPTSKWKTLLSNISEIIPFPDTKRGWIIHGVHAGHQVIKRNRIDAIISIYAPASSHFIARRLKILHPEIKWIADYRDLWSHNPVRKHNRLTIAFLERIEVGCLHSADIITTVSYPHALDLEKLHKKQSVAIPNGFDPQEYDFETVIDRKFTITYTGSLYPQEKSPEVLFAAIKKILSEDETSFHNIEINFYGKSNSMLNDIIKKYGLEEIVKHRGMIPREEAIRRQKSSQILLVTTLDNTGVYTGKIFEYLGARRPILAIGFGKNVIKELLEETGAGAYCSEEYEVYRAVKSWYLEWKKTRIVRYKGKEEKVSLYSHKMMAEKFAMLLDNL